MPDQNLKIYIGSKIVDSKEVGVSTSCEMQNIRLVQKETFNFQIRKRKYHSFESKFSILYHEVWNWIRHRVANYNRVFSEDVKKKVQEVYSPRAPNFSKWSCLFRKRPMVDVTLRFEQSGDNNPEWMVLSIFNPHLARDSDDEKNPELSDEE